MNAKHSQSASVDWLPFETWQLNQLTHLAKLDPERIETVLNTIWSMYPSLAIELAIAAVDAKELTVAEAGDKLGLTEGEVEKRLAQLRRRLAEGGSARIVATERGAAVEETHVCVWEIVREYRRLGTVDRLTEAFPGLSVAQLGAALAYAREHPIEIEHAISAYEDLLARKRSEYPFA